MKVDRGRAIKKQLAGHTYHFCSEHCLREFEARSDGDPSTRPHPLHAH